MDLPKLFYSEPVYRPPSEGKKSLLITATIGCTYQCIYCYPYLKKKFAIRNIEDIKQDIKSAKILYGENIERIFLLDGNAFVMKPKDLIEIAEFSYKTHPNLKRISAYAHAKDITKKTDLDLKLIAKAGINMLYIGIETGDNNLLKLIKKRTDSVEIITAIQKLHKAGITVSGTIILGLAGNNPELSKSHAIKTAVLINQLNPSNNVDWYISALTLMIPPETQIETNVQTNQFIPMTNIEILKELKMIIKNISNNIHGCIFRANHASNYLTLKGNLSEDKEKLLNSIDYALENIDSLRAEYFRGL